jgi:uroporphyrin-III C-methyltransferase/precorrin-2 dehydrogenase/sirohydrochlorin ferrochelatase
VRARRPPKAGARRAPAQGVVSLVGAGPGDPELLSVRAVRRLQNADLVLYDGLVTRHLLTFAPRAEHVSVARRVGPKALSQAAVIAQMITAARSGRRVVRLKSGDPFVFGRGGEEAQALRAAGVAVEVVPGITTALAAPALAGIPVTHRDVASAFVVVSGHAESSFGPVVDRLVAGTATIVVLMGLGGRRALGQRLVVAGWPRSTPTAIVVNASRSGQRIWRGTLADLGRRDGITRRTDPGVIIIGNAVAEATSSEEFPS